MLNKELFAGAKVNSTEELLDRRLHSLNWASLVDQTLTKVMLSTNGTGKKTVTYLANSLKREGIILSFRKEKHVHTPSSVKLTGKSVSAVCLGCKKTIVVSQWRTQLKVPR